MRSHNKHVFPNLRIGSHVEHRVNDAEAAVVREIYERYARGDGYRRIAHDLSRRGLAKPRAQRGRPSGWDSGTIRAILEREIYRGQIVWNQSRKCDKWGRRAHKRDDRRRQESEWMRLAAPHLRIISEELTAAVDARRFEQRNRYLRSTKGQLLGRPHEGKYLLSGMLRCPCGANFEVLRLRYVCAARRRKGPTVCTHEMTFPVSELDESIMNAVKGKILAPSFIERLIESVFAPAADPTVLHTDRAQLAQEIGNLTAAIAAGGKMEELVDALKDRKRRLAMIDASLRQETPDRERLRAALEQRVDDWREVLRAQAQQGRQVVRQILGPIRVRLYGNGDATFEPTRMVDEDGTLLPIGDNEPWWEADVRPEGLLVGLILPFLRQG